MKSVSTNRASTTLQLSKNNSTTTSNIIGNSSSQPSIIVYISSHDIIAVGYDNVPQPRHIISNLSSQSSSAIVVQQKQQIVSKPLRNLHEAEILFQYYATPIERLINLLGGGSPNSITQTTTGLGSSNSSSSNNRYIVLHDQGLYVNRYWKLAITRILQDVCHATYISFLSTIHMIPFAIVTPPPIQNFNETEISRPRLSPSSSSAVSVVLSVHITGNEAQCMIYANGHHLEYTYQSCDYVTTSDDTIAISSSDTKNDEDVDVIIMVDDLRKRQEQWLIGNNNNSNSTTTTSPLICAIALCLEKCPVPVRKDAIQNIYFSGTILVHRFQERVAILLYTFLTNQQKPEELHTTTMTKQPNAQNSDEQEISTALLATTIGDERIRTSPNTTMIQFTQIPINRTVLRPLATSIAIIDTNNNNTGTNNDVRGCNRSTTTTELIPWVGTSIYSTYWRCNREQDTGRLAQEEMNWINIAATQPNPWNKKSQQ